MDAGCPGGSKRRLSWGAWQASRNLRQAAGDGEMAWRVSVPARTDGLRVSPVNLVGFRGFRMGETSTVN